MYFLLYKVIICFSFILGRLLLTLYLVSDSYIGLDQQIDLPLELLDQGHARGDTGGDPLGHDDFRDDFDMEEFPKLEEVRAIASSAKAVGEEKDPAELEEYERIRKQEEEFWLNFFAWTTEL